MQLIQRLGVGVVGATAAVLLAAGPAVAHQCTNANKPPAAGAQAVLGPDGEPVFIKSGFLKRIDKGLIDPEAGDFHGIVAFDIDGTLVSSYFVGPNGELPHQAQENGSPDHGIVNICAVIDCG